MHIYISLKIRLKFSETQNLKSEQNSLLNNIKQTCWHMSQSRQSGPDGPSWLQGLLAPQRESELHWDGQQGPRVPIPKAPKAVPWLQSDQPWQQGWRVPLLELQLR